MKYIVPLVLFLFSCHSLPLPASDSVYRKDLPVIEGDILYLGVGVLPFKPEYQFTFKGRHNPERIRVTTGHRAGTWFDQKKSFTWSYKPTPVETAESILKFSFFDDRNRHQFGMLVFRANDENLFAKVYCNGDSIDAVGTSICQAEEKTLQGIDFQEPVRAVTQQGCTEPKSIDEPGTKWRWLMQKDTCISIFKTKAGATHRVVSFGYTDLVTQ